MRERQPKGKSDRYLFFNDTATTEIYTLSLHDALPICGVELGAGEIVVNSIDADGTKQGYELRLTRLISEQVTVPVVASGGAGNAEHMVDVLTDGKADAALAASIFHYGTVRISEVKAHLQARGVPVRPVQAIPVAANEAAPA